jgi:hypothetical protein
MKIHDCEQMTLEWIRLHFGIPSAAGLDQLLTPNFELRKGEMPNTYVCKKVAEVIQNRPVIDLSTSSFMMEQGMILESEARPWFELEYDKKVKTIGFITTDDGRFGCSPDGLIECSECDGKGWYSHGSTDDPQQMQCQVCAGTGLEECGLEIKSPAAHTHVKYLVNGVLPKEYVAQVLGSMFVTGFKKWIFVSYRRGFPALVLEIYRDEKAMSAIASAIDSFHADFERAMDRISNITKLREIEAA